MTETARARRILITDFDLFLNLGGGQTVYHRLIASRPNDTFYYFLRRESSSATRPANAVGIPFVPEYQTVLEDIQIERRRFLWAYRDARNLAFSAAQQLGPVDFDVVDVPDYTQHGIFIRAALEAEGIQCGTVALALHGTLSAAWEGGWPGPNDGAEHLASLKQQEMLQFQAVDARYAISAAYARKWQNIVPLSVNLVDPLAIVGTPDPRPAVRKTGAPDLAFVGRREKWKGPDLFLDLAWCVDPSLYNRLIVVGPDGRNRSGIGSSSFLEGIARLRRIRPEILGGQSKEKVREILADRSLLVLPSRHDTFNLVALESIAAGCPVLVSHRAGIAVWIAENLPGLDWATFNIDCARTGAGQAADVLRHYDDRRDALIDAVRRLPPAGPDSFDDIYRPSDKIHMDGRQTVVELAAHFTTLSQLATPTPLSRAIATITKPMRDTAKMAGRAMPAPVRRLRGPIGVLKNLRRNGLHWSAKERIKQLVRKYTGFSPRTFVQIARCRAWVQLRQTILVQREADAAALKQKLQGLSDRVSDHLVNRVPLFQTMARLERSLGRDLVAATYALRIMRWMGEDTFGELPFVCATLREHGFPYEAETAEAMFGPEDQREARCLDLMRDAYRRNLTKAELPLAVLDDRRGDAPRRVAVIVSLYNAAEKLPTLLACLAQQTIARRGELEVVLVDSNSPTDERAALEGFLAHHDLPVVYARSAERETIQKAWNRGIKLARAPYLAFLGADEGLHPDALQQLADALDADPGVDWAMADSVVTDVDANGVYVGDVMPYDRSGYRQDLVYLETCYLSWVGALYRRSIHDRFGYYDETYRAAGDTEFKNRVMPHIHSVHVPNVLGVFNNYPEERTTAHPRAEIEDLRAWYLWRTSAGMRYAFDNRPAEDAVALFKTALNYRKSFCGHLSSDMDLADALARYLESRPDISRDWVMRARKATTEALEAFHGLEYVDRAVRGRLSALALAKDTFTAARAARGPMASRHRSTLDLASRPHYELFNDNRYEQHWWSWSGV